MGTSYFSVLSLEKLLKNKYNVVGIVTTTDRFSIRKKSIFVESAVKKYSRLHALPILQSDDLKYSLFLDTLRKWKTEIIIIVAFRMLPKVVWKIPILCSFNLHPSLLPNYRGSSPIQWVIMNGEHETGLTTFLLNEKVDMGKMLYQKKIFIEKKENAGSLSIRLAEIGSNLVIDTLNSIISNCIEPKKQPTNFYFKLAPKFFRQNSKINCKSTIKEIYNKIRGLSPFPGAWCVLTDNFLKKKEFKIYNVEYILKKHYQCIGNVLIEKKNMKIAVNEGYLLILECQLEGKQPMLVKCFMNGKQNYTMIL